MSTEKIKQLNRYHGSNWIGSGTPSMSYSAVYQRIKRLNNDAFADKANASTKKSRNKRKQKDLVRKNEWKSKTTIHSKALEDRVAFHLGRGRSASDIVIREGIKSSVIQAIIAKITAAASTATP